MDEVEDTTSCREYEDCSGLDGILQNLAAATTPFMVAIGAVFSGHQQDCFVAKLKASEPYRSDRVRILSLERLDIMRWSLSQYFKDGKAPQESGDREPIDPQFQRGKIVVQRKRYDLSILTTVASKFVGCWDLHAQVTSRFESSVASFIFYEDLLYAGKTAAESEALFAHYVMYWVMHGVFLTDRATLEELVAVNVSPTYTPLPATATAGVTKFHPDNIDDWVDNAEEVREMFESSHFSEILRNSRHSQYRPYAYEGCPSMAAAAINHGVQGRIAHIPSLQSQPTDGQLNCGSVHHQP